jgi:tRNA G18 (ribose-2'-O)-methylase SpoU
MQKVSELLAHWQPGRLPSLPFCFHGILDNIRSAENVGSILRTAEGAGVQHLHLCGLTPTPIANTSLAKSALGAETRIDWSSEPNAPKLVERLKKEGFLILVLECAPTADNLYSLLDKRIGIAQKNSEGKSSLMKALEDVSKIALVVGNEAAGVDPGIVELADHLFFIPMSGIKSSLNVSVAFALGAYGILNLINVNSEKGEA